MRETVWMKAEVMQKSRARATSETSALDLFVLTVDALLQPEPFDVLGDVLADEDGILGQVLLERHQRLQERKGQGEMRQK